MPGPVGFGIYGIESDRLIRILSRLGPAAQLARELRVIPGRFSLAGRELKRALIFLVRGPKLQGHAIDLSQSVVRRRQVRRQ